MLNKLGLIINNLEPNQDAFYLINWVNVGVGRDNLDITVFYNSPSIPCINIGFGMMHMQEAWFYNGPLIANSLNLAAKLLQFVGTKEKYFYVWDLEWLRMKNKNYHMLANIYRNPSLRLLARSQEHAKVIEDCWNVQVHGIVNNYCIDDIMRILHNENNKRLFST